VSLSISSANPIQFWLTGEESFNNKEECSIYPVCFCQPSDPSDPIRLEITDPLDGQNNLAVYSNDNQILKYSSFKQIGTTHNQYTYLSDLLDAENKKVILKIFKNISSSPKILPLTSWTNGSCYGDPYTSVIGNEFILNSSSPPNLSGSAYQLLTPNISSGNTIIFNLVITTTNVINNFVVRFYDNNDPCAGSSVGFQQFTNLPSGTYTKTINIHLSGIAKSMDITAVSTISPANITITVPVNQLLLIADTDILAASDCIDIVEDECTKLITYSNSSDFAGLTFEGCDGPIDFQNDTFITSLSPWLQNSLGNDVASWVWQSNGSILADGSSPTKLASKLIYQQSNCQGWPIGVYSIRVNGNNQSSASPPFGIECIFLGSNDGFTTYDLIGGGLTNEITATGVFSKTYTITTLTNYDAIGFYMAFDNSSSPNYFKVYLNSITILSGPDPSVTYNLRIPAVFFDEQFPQEQEDLELSDDTIITLWSKIEGKKLLDIGFMPFYMHKKLQMVLMMDTVSIDGIEYRMRDPYQITSPASKRSAIRRASILLSEKDFINRNLL